MNIKGFEESDSDDYQPSSQAQDSYAMTKNQNQVSDLIDDADSSQSQRNQDQSDNDEEHSSSESSEPPKSEQLERQILREAIQKQKKRKPFQQQVMGEIIDKIRNYQQAASQKTGQQLITLRIQELVYNKILVQSYNCSEFRIILAHYHLAQAYLSHECLQQAIQHITLSIFKNERLFEELPMTIQFHCRMLNLLGESLMAKGEYDDAVESLLKCVEIANKIFSSHNLDEQSEEEFEKQEMKKFSNPDDVANSAKILLSKCYLHHKQYQEAIDRIDEVLDSVKSKPNSEEAYALALVQKANIFGTQQRFSEAIETQQQAINTLIQINYPKPQMVAELYNKLSQYFQAVNNSQNCLSCLQKVKTLYQQLYPATDKRIIKARRRIATGLLKNQRFKEAINQLLDILELEEKVFGDNCLQVARTLKLLGTVYISMDIGHAKNYLKRSLTIFNSNGHHKQVAEIKNKIKMIASNNRGQMGIGVVNQKLISQQDL